MLITQPIITYWQWPTAHKTLFAFWWNFDEGEMPDYLTLLLKGDMVNIEKTLKQTNVSSE